MLCVQFNISQREIYEGLLWRPSIRISLLERLILTMMCVKDSGHRGVFLDAIYSTHKGSTPCTVDSLFQITILRPYATFKMLQTLKSFQHFVYSLFYA